MRIAHAASFSRITDHLTWIGRPISRENPALHIPVKRRIGPIDSARHQPMFDRVVVDVIHVMFEIDLISYLMFPETSLPQVGFTSPDA